MFIRKLTYKEISAFVRFCCMIQHLNILQMQFFALSLRTFIKVYIYFLSLRFTLVFFSSDVTKCNMCDIK